MRGIRDLPTRARKLSMNANQKEILLSIPGQ